MSNDDLIERLEAEAKVADAEPEELTVAVESDVEDTEARAEELQSEVDEKDAEVEELQSLVEEKNTEVEELQGEIDTVKDFYAEQLSEEAPILDADEFKERYDVSELREKFDDLEEDSEPAPNSADSGPNVQSAEGDDPEGTEEVEEELSERRQVAAKAFRERARQTDSAVWEEIAEMTENPEEDSE